MHRQAPVATVLRWLQQKCLQAALPNGHGPNPTMLLNPSPPPPPPLCSDRPSTTMQYISAGTGPAHGEGRGHGDATAHTNILYGTPGRSPGCVRRAAAAGQLHSRSQCIAAALPLAAHPLFPSNHPVNTRRPKEHQHNLTLASQLHFAMRHHRTESWNTHTERIMTHPTRPAL
jgi:hypothetical protein